MANDTFGNPHNLTSEHALLPLDSLGPRPQTRDGIHGWLFRLWAPGATAVSVVGSFNNWDPVVDLMRCTSSGLWEAFLIRPQSGDLYKYVVSAQDGSIQYYGDLWARSTEHPPGTASKLCDPSGFLWQDANWLRFRQRKHPDVQPQLLYHLRLDSWRRTGSGSVLSSQALTNYLIPYLKEMGYTGAVLLSDPGCFFAPSAPLGTPYDLMYLIDHMHRAGLHVFLDWHPDHISPDDRCLLAFDPLPEFRQREVRSFLVSSARFWLEEYHLDGLRINILDPILYLAGSGITMLLQELQEMMQLHCPDAALILNSPAPVSSFSGWQERPAFPLLDLFQGKTVTLSPELTLSGLLSFPAQAFHTPLPAFSSCFSGSLCQQWAAARSCYLAFLALPGKKLFAMGADLGQRSGWCSGYSLDWHLLERISNRAYHHFFQVANNFYLTEPFLWAQDDNLQWLSISCAPDAVFAFLRQNHSGSGILCLCNPTNHNISCATLVLPDVGACQVLISSDEARFGGTGTCSILPSCTIPAPSGSRLQFRLPPLTSALIRYIPANRQDTQEFLPSDDSRSR